MSARLSVRTTSLALVTAGLAVTGTVLTGGAAVAGDKDKTVSISAVLSGAQEVPGPGDIDGSGTGTLRIDRNTGEICYTLAVANIAPAVAAHIHEAPRGVAGPVVNGLMAPSSGSSSGCVTNKALAKDLVADPSDYYLNVHNADFPGGAVRGQLG